jgi:hypothetical protein
MVKPSRRADGPRLGEALDAYRIKYGKGLNARAQQVLRRLERSAKARNAFERLSWLKTADGKTRTFPEEGRIEPDGAMAIVKACVEAEQLARTFPQRIEETKERLHKAEQFQKAAALLRSFLGDRKKTTGLIGEQTKPSDPLRLREIVPDDEIKAMRYGLALIEMRIGREQHVARMNLSRLGATRKGKIDKAGQIAAIKWLASNVRELKNLATGQRARNPNLKEIAALAEAILDTGVTSEHVRRALRGKTRCPKAAHSARK